MAQRHIVVVDDDTGFRMLLRKLLEGAGYRVSEAKNALAVFSIGTPDLMILDIQMPGIDGHRILTSLKEDKSFTAPVVVLTGLSDPAHHKRSLDEGADAFMTKPVNKDVLLAKIAELLARQPV